MKYIKTQPLFIGLRCHIQSTPHRSVTGVAPPSSLGTSQSDALPISKMPGPRIFPVIGSGLSIFMHKDFDRKKLHNVFISLVKEYGPTIRLGLPGAPPTVIVTTPEDVETLYRVTTNNPIRKGNFSLKKVRDENEDNYFDKKGGVLTENDEEWWRVRSKVQAPMLKPKNIIRYLPAVDKTALEFMEMIADYQKKFNEMPETFLEDLYKWALESVALVALNRRLGSLQPNLPEDSMQLQMIRSANEMFVSLNKTEVGLQLWRLFATPSYKNLKKNHDLFLKIAIENIRQTEEEFLAKKAANQDVELTLIETLLNTEGLIRRDVVTMILDMLIAGIDTTSHAVAFALYLLAKNPEVQTKLQKELDDVLGDGKQPLNEHHLARLSYLKCCVKESFRIFPLFTGNLRMLETDAVFGGYLIPKGFQVLYMIQFITTNESIFPRAKEFIPERWGRDAPLGRIHPFASLPFSHGTRMCIGRRIAEQEIYTFLARALHRYNVHYKYKDMEIWTKLINAPSEPLRFQFTERR